MSWPISAKDHNACLPDVCAIFYPPLEVTYLKKKHVCVTDTSAEGTCDNYNNVNLFPDRTPQLFVCVFLAAHMALGFRQRYGKVNQI